MTVTREQDPQAERADEAELDAVEPDGGAASGGGARWLVVVTALALAVIAVLAIGTVAVGRAAAVDGVDADRAEVVEVAREVVGGMVAIDGAAATAGLDQIVDLTTDPLRSQLAGFSSVFVEVLQQGQVQSSGVVTSAGVESIGAGAASVLLSVDVDVTNTEVPDGARRTFRMVVSLREDAGRWLASAVEVAA